MANDPKREAELAIARLQARKEMRSADLDEDSAVITQRARENVPSSTPPAAKGIVAVLGLLPPWGRVLVILLALVLLGGSGIAAKVAGWF